MCSATLISYSVKLMRWKEFNKNLSERIFIPVLAIYGHLFWDIIRTRYRLLKKKSYFFQKWRWWRHRGQFRTRYSRPAGPCAHFIYTFQTLTPPAFYHPTQKTRISVTFGRFGAFPDLWRHPMEALFCVCANFTYRSNETFCSRTHRFG